MSKFAAEKAIEGLQNDYHVTPPANYDFGKLDFGGEFEHMQVCKAMHVDLGKTNGSKSSLEADIKFESNLGGRLASRRLATNSAENQRKPEKIWKNGK